MDVRRLAASLGKTSIFWLAPVHEGVELALKEAGFSTEWENTAFVFEKKHPDSLRESSTWFGSIQF
jgi:hypothetical protein